jgi:GT2 family glycosyltransferase
MIACRHRTSAKRPGGRDLARGWDAGGWIFRHSLERWFSHMSPMVSVVIPTYNRAAAVVEAIDSVLAQGLIDLEIIVVDDGSSDGTGDVVATTFGDEPRLRYRYQPNAGVPAARNTGLDLATGAYVAFLDSDDTWQPWHLRLMLAALDREPTAGMIWTETDAVDAEGSVASASALSTLLSAYARFSKDDLFAVSSPLAGLATDIPSAYADRRLYVGDVFSPMVMGNLVLTSSVVIRRERLEMVGRFDPRLKVGEDYEFFLRACRAGPVAFADIPDVRYRIGTADKLGGSSSGLAMAQAYLRVLDATLDEDAARITLPPSMVATARAHAHSWVGEMELLDGSPRLARAHFATALRIRIRQPWIIVLTLLTFLPPGVVQRLVTMRRSLKSWRA